ncbi:potassium channel subfamily K member 2-like [Panonychus citri]|uniref:potassium channel subfamily K member 2-like n=1 Tax=Panonychus citri TaxID=50023 RepID=UPI002307AC8F|nr:potassium channel subfamily K member 2-like [Panonychus citri]
MNFQQLVCLLIIFVFYLVIGAIVFMTLESEQSTESVEIQERRTLIRIKDILLSMNLNSGLNDRKRDKMLTLIERELTFNSEYSMKWGFFNSLFFTITVVTTVGYGHLSPLTSSGRIFCIVYSLLGIPLTGIILNEIGDRFSDCFLHEINRIKINSNHFLSDKIFILLRGLIFFLSWFIGFIIIPALVFHSIEGWTFLESFYYCFVTLSTIGFGDLVPGQFDRRWNWIYKIIIVCWIILGFAYLSMILNCIKKGFQSEHLTNVVRTIKRVPKKYTWTKNFNQFKITNQISKR